jgi:2-polyprenyl-6-hydroxyphenyl methylase/3-demethylubiquinone-9 3-methyltransferase
MHVDSKEVEKFTEIAFDWWNPDGKFQPLHAMNLVRLEYIKDKILNQFGALDKIKILDVGCGGGLASIPLANLGADVVGIDAGLANIEAAQEEAKKQNIVVNFQNELLENIEEQFDVVISLEVIEHVPNYAEFLEALALRVKKDGMLIISTINRNFKSYLLGIVAAEYLLRWVDIGTHEHKKFVKPSEIHTELKKRSFIISDIKGVEYEYSSTDFKLTNNIDVNYILCAKEQS